MVKIVKVMLDYWAWIAFPISIFWGLYGCQFVFPNHKNKLNKFFNYSYQFNINFISSLAGWCCLYILGNRYLAPNIEPGVADLVLFIFVLLGLTCNLPYTLFGIAGVFSELAKAMVKKIEPK
jgi:hypothetical protein